MVARTHVIPWWRPLLLVAAVASRAVAQPDLASLSGSVRDSAGAPIALAQLTVSGVRGLSDSAGRFAFAGLRPGAMMFTVRRLGFEPRDVAVQLVGGGADSVHVVLRMLPRELAAVTAEGGIHSRLLEFYRHKKNGMGHYFDRQQIEERRVHRLSDIVRRIPGARIVSDRNGRSQLRMGRTLGGRDCPPDFWIDGVRALFLGVDDIPVSDIEALEIYHGPSGLPPEFNSRMGNPGCGAVVIWTRVPG